MDVKPGDRIAIETERLGQPEREGEVLEIKQDGMHVTYRIRWDDGHESLLTPAAGSVHVVSKN